MSFMGPTGTSESLLASSSRSSSFLNSFSATLKSKASLRSLKAIPMNACLPWAFVILSTK